MLFPTENFRHRAALLRFVLTCVLGLALDLWTKSYSFEHLFIPPVPKGTDRQAIEDAQLEAARDPRPHKIDFIPGWVVFENVKNRGAVFGLGQGKRTLFLAVSVLAIGFLTYLFATSGKQRFYQFVLGMLLAGVLGNMYDRVALGYVRDMIHALPGWTWGGSWHVPFMGYPGDPTDPRVPREVFPFVFNVADIFLCVGVGLMIVYSLFSKPPAKEGEAGKTDSSPREPERA